MTKNTRRTYLREHYDDQFFLENVLAACMFGKDGEFTIEFLSGKSWDAKYISVFSANNVHQLRVTFENGDKEVVYLASIELIKWRPI